MELKYGMEKHEAKTFIKEFVFSQKKLEEENVK
jgi:hypothetical protein